MAQGILFELEDLSIPPWLWERERMILRFGQLSETRNLKKILVQSACVNPDIFPYIRKDFTMRVFLLY